MATIANLDVNLRANTKKFDKGMMGAKASVKSFGSVATIATTAAVAGFAALTATMRQFAAAGDAIDKISARTRIAAQDVQSLTFAFQQNGGSAGDLETSVRSLNRNILDLQRGSKTAIDNFKDLGLTFDDLQGLDAGDRFRLVAKSLANIQDESLQAGVALKVFGRSGSQILPLLDNLGKLEKQYEALDIAFSDKQVKLAAELTDEWNIFLQTSAKLGAEIGELFGPTFKLGIRGLTALVSLAKELVQAFNDNVFVKLINFLADGASDLINQIRGIPDVKPAPAGAGPAVAGPRGNIVQRDLLFRINSTEKEQLSVLKSISRGVNRPQRIVQPSVLN